ncbi:uncharacterized protein KZ484_023454 [Pholidichthys leucotaenia]
MSKMSQLIQMADYHADRGALFHDEASTPSPSRFRRWLFPSVMVLVLLGLITMLAVTSMNTSNRLSSMEQRISDVNDIVQSLDSSVQGMNMSNHLSSVEQRLSDVNDIVQSLDLSVKQVQGMKMSSRLSSLEQSVSSMNSTLQSLDSSLKQVQGSATKAPCPQGWIEFGYHCFHFSRTFKSWEDSKAGCEEQQANLVILKLNMVWEFVVSEANGKQFWVGLSDGRTGSWEWVDQTPYSMDSSKWRPGNPDNWTGHGRGGGEDCAHIAVDGLLNDNHCSVLMRFICQKRIVQT